MPTDDMHEGKPTQATQNPKPKESRSILNHSEDEVSDRSDHRSRLIILKLTGAYYGIMEYTILHSLVLH